MEGGEGAAAQPSASSGRAGWAPVRSEFLISKEAYLAERDARNARLLASIGSAQPARSRAASAPPASEASADASMPAATDSTGASAAAAPSTAAEPDGTEEPARKRAKGAGGGGGGGGGRQNKHRSGEELGFFAGLNAGAQLCRWVQQGQPERCRFGDRCRDSHDVATYLANKPADLGARCHNFELRGYCPAGLSCRFGDCHVDRATGTNISKPPAERPVVPESVNFLRGEVATGLRKQTYVFKLAPPFQKRGGGSGGGGAAAAPAGGPSGAKTQMWVAPSKKHAAAAKPAAPAAAPASAPAPASDSSAVEPAAVQQATAAVTAAATAPASAAAAVAAVAVAATDDSYEARVGATSSLRVDAALRPAEKKRIDFRNKVYVAPLTTVGNLPFRRVVKGLGADITIGEMALASNILSPSPTEWALLRRHPCEDVFGIQLAGSHPETMARAAELISNECAVDFVDINCGCPLDAVCAKGMGGALMGRPGKLREICTQMDRILACPVTVKMRTGIEKEKDERFAHKLIAKMRLWSAAASAHGRGELLDGEEDVPHSPVAAVTVHGRTRQQRYTSTADWGYITSCVAAARSPVVMPYSQLKDLGLEWSSARAARQYGVEASQLASYASTTNEAREITLRPAGMPVIGNGDVLTWREWQSRIDETGVDTVLLARGVLMKPWLCTEIAERRDWDISSQERLGILQKFANYGLEHWGSDQSGVNHTRRFMLEWLSFLHRYIPLPLLEVLPQKMNDRPPAFVGRNDLETLMASPHAEDWVRITELLLGPVPSDFVFLPKHKSNSYSVAEGGGDGSRVAVSAAALRESGSLLGKRPRLSNSPDASGSSGGAGGADAAAVATAGDEDDEEGSDVEG